MTSKFSRFSIATFKSMCNILKKSTVNYSLASLISFWILTSSRFYLIVNDLFRIFVEKSNSFDLQRHQMRSFSSKIHIKCNFKSNCDFIQSFITSYFHAIISFAFKSIFQIDQIWSICINSCSRNLFASFFDLVLDFIYFFSFRFSKMSRRFSVCKHCQWRFVIYWFISWVMSNVSTIENKKIFMKVHFLTIKRFVRFRCISRKLLLWKN